jgi:hypothetical protein
MVNRTNNALERYNCHFNSLFPKNPGLIKFVQLVEQESRSQAERLDLIRAGKHCEVSCPNIWAPDIPMEYYDFKAMLDKQEKEESDEMLLEEDEDSNDGNLPINHVQSRKKKATKKGDEGGEKKVAAKRVPLANVKVNCCGRAIKAPRKNIV